MIHVIIPGLAVRSEANARGHWTKRHGRTAKAREVVGLVLATKKPPALPVRVLLTRIAPKALDLGDNLAMSLKAVRDATAAWLGVDDRDPRVEWRIAQQSGKPREYGVEIHVAHSPPWSVETVSAEAREDGVYDIVRMTLSEGDLLSLARDIVSLADGRSIFVERMVGSLRLFVNRVRSEPDGRSL